MGRYDKRKVEEQEGRLDIQSLRRAGALDRGMVEPWETWLKGRRVTVRIYGEDNSIRLECSDGVSLYKTIRLEWTHCYFGGQRPWFKCPDCRERVGVLFFDKENRNFACRQCLKLVYESQCEGDTTRRYRKAQKTMKQLGLKAPPRPKGMHWATYERLLRPVQPR